MDLQKQKSAVAWLSVGSNSALVAGKIIVGLAIGSVSVLSEAIHSGIDLLAAVIALLAVRASGKPADEQHPFGHGKMENISGTIEALLILLAAGWIVYEAIGKLQHPEPLHAPAWGVAVMAASAAANMFVSTMLFRVARRTQSVALEADAWHLRTDVYTSVGVMVGLGAMWLAARVAPQWDLWWLDPVAALVVAALILKAAWDLTIKAARDLLDVQLPPEELQGIQSAIEGFRPRVLGYHRLRTRKAGHCRFVEFHAFVDASMSVDESHSLTHDIGQAIRDLFADAAVTVHVEPCNGQCRPHCIDGCFEPRFVPDDKA